MREHDDQVHRLRVPVSEADWVRGPADAPVSLAEYGDYQCPHCQRAYYEVEKLLGAQGPQVKFSFRHLPITSVHPRAMPAAIAADAAGRQGKFWEMHRKLYESQGSLEEGDIARYAQEIGLDLEQFARDREDPEIEKHILQQRLEGVRSGANGTPTFFINGERYDGEFSFEGLSAAVEAAK